MPRSVEITIQSFPIAGSFTISRGAKTSADVILCRVRDGEHVGSGECVPYPRYGESLQSVATQLEAMRSRIAEGLTRAQLQEAMPAGAARNAIDCALWDLEAKLSGIGVAETIGVGKGKPLLTAYTISLGSAEEMAAKASENAHRPILKVKVGTSDDAARILAVRAAAPHATLILDANEGWSPQNLARHLAVAADAGVALVEQPLPAAGDGFLSELQRPVPVCADESVHQRRDLPSLVDRYDAINIKLDKAGGLTEALAMKKEGQNAGLKIMVGCMVSTSLAMAPAVLLAQDADFVDLDGPLLLSRDRENALRYDGETVFPPQPALWG